MINVNLTDNLWGPIRHLKGSGSIIFALRTVLLKYLDAIVDNPYNTVIMTRSDHVWACDHPIVRASVGVLSVMEGQ